MKTQRLRGLFLILGVTIFATTVYAQAQLSNNPNDWVVYGDNLWRSGNPQAALPYYFQAYNLASRTGDPYVMSFLAANYLALHYEQAAAQCYAAALSYALQWMRSDPGRGPRFAYGFKALQDLVNYYNSTLRTIPASQATQDWFSSQTRQAANAVAVVVAPPPQPSPTPPQPPPNGGSSVPPCPATRDVPNWDDLPCVPYAPRTPNLPQ